MSRKGADKRRILNRCIVIFIVMYFGRHFDLDNPLFPTTERTYPVTLQLRVKATHFIHIH